MLLFFLSLYLFLMAYLLEGYGASAVFGYLRNFVPLTRPFVRSIVVLLFNFLDLALKCLFLMYLFKMASLFLKKLYVAAFDLVGFLILLIM